MLPVDYAGFRKGRSCVDQILALSTYIESGFERKLRIYIEHALTNDLAILEKYYRDWRLCLNPDKTDVSYFHLNNRESNEKLNVSSCGKTVKFNPNQKYLGYTMDRNQTHKPHMEKVAQKLKSRNNIIQKLAYFFINLFFNVIFCLIFLIFNSWLREFILVIVLWWKIEMFMPYEAEICRAISP